MKKIKYIISLLLVINLFINCQRDNLYTSIDFGFENRIEVENYKNERGTSILNNTFALHSASPLVSKKPNWLVEKNPAEYNFREKEFLPTIHDVEPPYILIKKPQSYQFIVIKNSDTRVFRLEEY